MDMENIIRILLLAIWWQCVSPKNLPILIAIHASRRQQHALVRLKPQCTCAEAYSSRVCVCHLLILESMLLSHPKQASVILDSDL